jgi:LysM repeat protein
MFLFGFIISLATHASATPTPTGTIQPSATVTFTPTVTPTPHVITATPGAMITYAPGTPTPGQCRYTVRAGDTLAGIAARYNTSAKWLAAAAHISQPDKLVAGQTLSFSCYSTPTPTGG